MGLVNKLRKAIILFVLTGSMILGCQYNYQPPVPNSKTEVIDAFPISRIKSMQQKLSGKKLAVALITNYDHNNATKGMDRIFKEDFTDLPDYVLYTSRVNNVEELFNNLRDYSALKPIDALILAYHGDKNGININSKQRINRFNAKELFKDYSSVFSKDAVILLYSCSTGEGRKNIATSLADVLDRDVIAPKVVLIPETSLKPGERIGEFSSDENGRVSFDFDNFRTYGNIDFKGKKYMNALAPSSYEKVGGNKINNIDGKGNFLFVDK